jgi:hypothetical protein
MERDQKGWSACLPKVRFDIMNTINKSTGHTPFQLRFGQSPRVLPPIIPCSGTSAPEKLAKQVIQDMRPMELEAMDNLLTAKIDQANQANKHRLPNFNFQVNDWVLLSTKHR